ncbi:hypothetical protein HDE_13312 [Halotydeus destructor]|nr:hypothetical protein HDE_13312 [Halotydeus destructor]
MCALRKLKFNAGLIPTDERDAEKIIMESGQHVHTPQQDRKLNDQFLNEIKAQLRLNPENSAQAAYYAVREKWAPSLTQEKELDSKPYNMIRSNLQKYLKRVKNEGPEDEPLSGTLTITNQPFVIMDSITNVNNRIFVPDEVQVDSGSAMKEAIKNKIPLTPIRGWFCTLHKQYIGTLWKLVSD